MSASARRRAPVDNAVRRAVLARDAGLRKISATTRWVAAAVIALSGALALMAERSFHGHATSNPPAAATQSQNIAPTTSIQQPSQAPVPTQQAPVVVSGGS